MPTTGGGLTVVSLLSGSHSLTSNLIEVPPVTLSGSQNLYTQQSAAWSIQSGYNANQADLRYTALLTLSATPTVLDLTNLVDPFGLSVNFARVKSILIVNLESADGGTVAVGYSSTTTHAWTSWLSNPGQLTVAPGTTAAQGALFAMAPNTTGWVVSSTNKLLNLDPGSNTVHVTVEIVGCSV